MIRIPPSRCRPRTGSPWPARADRCPESLWEEKASLDFPGYTFRWDRDLYGRDRRYLRDRRNLNVAPSKKAPQRDRINELADRRQGCTPISRLIVRLNRQLKGVGQLLLPGLPGQGVPEDQPASWLSTGEPLKASSQPAPVQIDGGCVAIAAD